MSWLLDTCVLSELLKRKPSTQVVQWFRSHPEPSYYLSSLTIGEFQKGAVLQAHSQKRQQIELSIESIIQRFEGRILPIDSHVAALWGTLQAEAKQKGIVWPAIDALLAATALAHRLTFVTRNTKDVKSNLIKVCNPWET